MQKESMTNCILESTSILKPLRPGFGRVWLALGPVLAPLGPLLGVPWASLGRLLAALGRSLGVQNRLFFKLWRKIGSQRPSGSILGPFWKGLGWFWAAFGQILGRFWIGFGRFWAGNE